jgi:hypothetical protein
MIEAQQFVEDYRDERLPNCKERFMLNGSSECVVLNDVGEIKHKKPSILDNLKGGDTSNEDGGTKVDDTMAFEFKYLPKFLKISNDIDELIIW